MIASKQSQACPSNRLSFIWVVATAGLSVCGCCAGLPRHQPIACYDCACASHGCPGQPGQSSAPLAAAAGRNPSAGETAFIAPPTTPAPKLVVRPALIQAKAKTDKRLQSDAEVSTGVTSTSSASESATEPASDIEFPFAMPSNTLIIEINDAALPNPASNDQSQACPDQVIPKLKASVESDFSAALQMNGRNDPQAAVENAPRIMFAVPPLRPTNIPPLVRFVKIEDSIIANTQRQIYSLTATPVLPGAQVLSIEPILEGLRIGRPITPSPTVGTIRR